MTHLSSRGTDYLIAILEGDLIKQWNDDLSIENKKFPHHQAFIFI